MFFALVVLGLVSSVIRQEIGWKERLWDDLFLCRVGCETLTQLDSMRWFSHRPRGPRPRGPLPKKCHTRTAPHRTMPEQFAAILRFFVPGDLDLWPWHSNSGELRFCRMHLTAKFHHPTFNRSEVIVLTNKQTNWQTDAVGNIHLAPLCYAGG